MKAASWILFFLLAWLPSTLLAASCCGGGGGGALILPKFLEEMGSLGYDQEEYHGFWNGQGSVTPDPAQSKLKQHRLTLGYAKRLAPNWQGSLSSAYVYNDNQYAGLSRQTQGLGDTTLALTYENFDRITCVNEVQTLEDLLPASYFGLALILPTGVSPYDEVTDSFDITGKGFYRLDATASVEKTVYPWSVGVNFAYGKHFARMVNREYGTWVTPYEKVLGDRWTHGFSFGYTWFADNLDQIVLTFNQSKMQEGPSSINGVVDETTGFFKLTRGAQLSYATMDQGWVFKLKLSQSPSEDGLGRNFPITNIISLGVNHVFF